jgi:predicted glycoside hydrolase/deacetylase ChbG (UPF0249 family)
LTRVGEAPKVGGIMRRLIVNADDLGYDPEIDRGILEASRRGIVTSATAMIDTTFAARALAAAPATLAVGLHAVLDPALPQSAAEAEIRRQLRVLERLRGMPATHLDSHKHAHGAPPILEAMASVAVERGLPVRALDAAMRTALRGKGVATTDHFLGDARLRPCWTVERLLAALETLPEGTTEIMSHPGYAPSRTRTSFGKEREVELAALLDPRVRAVLERLGVELVRYDALRQSWTHQIRN